MTTAWTAVLLVGRFLAIGRSDSPAACDRDSASATVVVCDSGTQSRPPTSRRRRLCSRTILRGSVASRIRAVHPVGVLNVEIRYLRPATGSNDQRTRQIDLSALVRKTSAVLSPASIDVVSGSRLATPIPTRCGAGAVQRVLEHVDAVRLARQDMAAHDQFGPRSARLRDIFRDGLRAAR